MKGFKKDGKFIPTEKRSKSSLKKTDVVKTYQDKRTPEEKENQHSIIERKKRKDESIFEDSYDDENDDIEKQFGEIINIDSGYSSVYGLNDEYFKIGVQDGLGKDELDMIEEKLGYVIEEIAPTNNYFISATFKKKDDKPTVDDEWTKLSMEELRAISNNISYDNIEFGLANSIQNKITHLYTQKKEAGQ